MKKLISMMLMLCAFITFSACSSDDDGPTNPVSNAVVPTSAKIGAEVTVQGSGFAAGQTLYLQPEQGTEVNTNAKMSSSGATFTIPYTMTEGKVNVVLKTGNDSWTLGSMTLLAADNPISTLSLPGEMGIGEEVTLTGIGFAQGDKIVVGDKTLEATVTADGVKVTIPADLAEGEYAVTLVRGNASWELGKVTVFQPKRIKSIYVENGLLGMIGTGNVTMNFTYNADGTIAEITSPEGLSWKFTYEGKVVKTTSPLNDVPLEFTFENGKIVKSTAAWAEPDQPTTAFNYWEYNNNTLVSVTNKDKWYQGLQLTDITHEDGNLTSYNFGGNIKFTTDKSIKAIPGTIDVRYLANMAPYVIQSEDVFVGLLLNQQVTNSSYMPTKAHFAYQDFETGDDKWAEVDLNTTFKDNVLTIDFLSFQDLLMQGIYGTKLVVTYENK